MDRSAVSFERKQKQKQKREKRGTLILNGPSFPSIYLNKERFGTNGNGYENKCECGGALSMGWNRVGK